MTSILFFLILQISVIVRAESVSEMKDWKTFRSDIGYELKYPDCWNIEIDGPDDGHKIADSPDIVVDEGQKCSRPRFDPQIPNGFVISSWTNFKSKADAEKDLDKTENWRKKILQPNQTLIFKRLSINGNQAFAYVEVPEARLPWIRWKISIYCPSLKKLSISGPSMKSPAKEVLNKIKTGDLALPNPEKSIIESIRCVEPREKATEKK